MGAKEIGIAYHGTTDANGNYINNPISKPLQLTLHATTGCALGSQSRNCDAGAAGAVAGELIAENYFKNKLEENGAIIQGNEVIIDPTKTNLTLNEVQQFKNTVVEFAKIGGAVAAVPFVGSDDASAVYAGSYAGGNSAWNNATYYKDIKLSNYPKGKDYDLNVGLQYSLGSITVNHGTDGNGATINTIPSLGMGIYANAIPRGEDGVATAGYGIRDTVNFDVIGTNKGNFGFGVGLGVNAMPIPIPFNSSMSLDFDKQNN